MKTKLSSFISECWLCFIKSVMFLGILVAICKAIHLPIPTEPKQTANIPPAYHHNCSEKKANTPGDTSLQSISIKNSVASPPQKSTKPNFSSGGNCSGMY